MLRLINNQGVESSDGYTVKFTGRFTLEYREGERWIELEVEDIRDDAGNHVIEFRDLRAVNRWSAPFEHEAISVQKQQQIMENLRSAMEFLGLLAQFI